VTQISGETHTYEDEFPKDLGPPFVVNYTGHKIANATKPVYTVELDSGAFRALWELLEKEGKHRFPARGTISSYAALLRAVAAFRKTYWSVNEPPGPKPTIGKTRKITRRGR
jgi:hypothetical protein